ALVRLARVVDSDKGAPVEVAPPAGRVRSDHLRAPGLQFVADLHKERRLAVARVTGEQDKTHVPSNNRGKQLGVEQRRHVGVTGELVVQASIACVADAAGPVKAAQPIYHGVDDSVSRTRRDLLEEPQLASQFVSR